MNLKIKLTVGVRRGDLFNLFWVVVEIFDYGNVRARRENLHQRNVRLSQYSISRYALVRALLPRGMQESISNTFSPSLRPSI